MPAPRVKLSWEIRRISARIETGAAMRGACDATEGVAAGEALALPELALREGVAPPPFGLTQKQSSL